MSEAVKVAAWVLVSLAAIWLAGEIGVRLYTAAPLRTGFYTSIPRADAPALQQQFGLQACSGPGWLHLGWVADPAAERYRVEMLLNDTWQSLGSPTFGSFLTRQKGEAYRVWALPKNGEAARLVGETSQAPGTGSPPPVHRPCIRGAWQTLFQPAHHGRYINDHSIYQDAQGAWRLAGITSQTEGDFNAETHFAVGVSHDFPPPGGMKEDEPLCASDSLAWAPHVMRANGRWHMFWSPHRLYQAESEDGIHWSGRCVTMTAPCHKFFRDPMVLEAAPGQWLLYATGRGRYFSRVDLYQSFDLEHWQYIGAALRCTWGSERNSPFASTESPTVIVHDERYYLSVTYNNDSYFWSGILLLFKVWLNKTSYNDTLVFHADNPYEFGAYGGAKRAPNLVARLQTHAPEWLRHPQNGKWYITTCGWPWVSTLTHGEAAVAPLEWEKIE